MTTTLAEVAGRNARALRQDADVNLQDLARAARSYGLGWSTGSVGDFESGRAAGLNLATLLVVAAALSDATGRPITLADLFAGTGSVEVRDSLSVELLALRSMLSGQPVSVSPPEGVTLVHEFPTRGGVFVGQGIDMPKALRGANRVDPALHKRVLDDFREADERISKSLLPEHPYSAFVGAAAMAKRWGQTFVAERDQRAGSGANAQKRGRISRQLKADLQELIG